ncbi:CCA tRNA nucleotidyltransferase [Clostridium perfringens]|uniref:CCA tRNA nucleotidyltransferase n=1 Tax=Clostridium perfringens TaxID=1502 RepID=UPI0010943051|nr:CCA tRNA nucleotidyltransferase [Clostridium perfringens]EGT4143657.1 CCA tRNA nucleotidyltransferase [Clostridium perfringens]ELU5588420.1 CCA tRNA nucleotidyltransferase [Clostridium perfringens]MBO3389295.1 CCA tRNA nucleotidyltransferase [Clostridium perfringens]MBO3414656.1 CCA tRNA nucleotidyltransferase [Clostridium perfringens]MDM1007380.1 CCA tRNA nucleotidyltransferase [Clostridium perfringens]
MKLPNNVQYILEKFNSNGFEAFIVGGCVRDSLLNKKPQDYDITTNAFPEKIEELFDKTIPTGIKHGTVTVLIDKNPYEVTTYRVDGEYLNNRKPKDVKFVSNIEEDLSRRDFTINAMAYSPYLGFKDCFNGKEDLKNKLIRCVGDPDKRFSEDALRMLRAIRFSCQLNFKIEKLTAESIRKNFKLIKNISMERIQSEFTKIILSNDPDRGLMLLRKLGFSDFLIEEFKSLKLINCYDVYDDIHDTYGLINSLPKKLHVRLAGLFYKVFNSENAVEKCRTILKKLKYDNNTINDTCNLVENINNISCNMTRKKLKLLINSVGTENIFDLLDLQKSYLSYMDEYDTECIDILKNRVSDILASKEPIFIKDLAITGNDLITELNYKPGKNIGVILNFLLENVMQTPELNNKEDLLNLSKQFYSYN